MARPRPWPAPAVAALLLAAALALRAADFGNPVIHVDEQYYLLVGQRWLAGSLPYVDVWDRKPIGLFAVYAAAAALPGDDILGYQLLATLAASATALMVWGGACALGATRIGAIAAAFAYLLWLPLLGGRGGQAPVFYNLLVATAARLTLRLPGLERRGAIAWNGLAACLLAGLAIQIKPTTAFEGMFFGLAHCWRWARLPPPFVLSLSKHRPSCLEEKNGSLRLAGKASRSGQASTSSGRSVWGWPVAPALPWLLAGLAPTLAAAATYAYLGHLDAWWFANVTSILLRPGYPAGEIAMRLLGIVAQLSPLVLGVALAWRRRRLARIDERALAFGWAAAALIGFLAIGTYFDHYALPLLPPLATLAAIALGRRARVLVGTLGLGLLLVLVERAFVPPDAAGARMVARVVAANSRGSCPYVFIGDTVTYSLARACLPTPYAFPNFLAYTTERGATGIDEAAEVRRILERRPAVIVGSTRRLRIWNPASLAALRPVLARDYRVVFTAPRAGYRTVVWLRRDLAFRPLAG